MNNTIHIRVDHATLGYQKRKAVEILSDVCLDAHGGDFIGVVGLNGTGKSTLLKTICGLLPPLSGDVFFNGESITGIALNNLARKVAVVLTEKIGGFNLTVYDAVAAGQIPYTNAFHQLTMENDLIINEAISACGLDQYRDMLLSELSDGLFQKTVIAKALAQQTPALLLDEPSAFLDYASKHDLFILLKKLAEKDGKCILISSHDLDLVLKYCNKLCVVSDKHIEMVPIAEALENKSFLRIGGGFIRS